MAKETLIRNRYSIRSKKVLNCKEGKTEQHHAPGLKPRAILEKYSKGFPVKVTPGKFGNYSNGMDFQQSMQYQAQVKSYFEKLPSEMRQNFKNDFRNLYDFMSKEENRDEAVKLGLIEKVEDEKKIEVPSAPITKEPDAPSQSAGATSEADEGTSE